MTWQRVVFAADCRLEDWDEEGEHPICPVCDIGYVDCSCPGPMQEDEFDYKEESGVLYAKRKKNV